MPHIMSEYRRAVLAQGMGRGLHLSTFQLNVSAFCELYASTFRLDVSTLCGLCWEVSLAKTSHVKLRSGRLKWLQ